MRRVPKVCDQEVDVVNGNVKKTRVLTLVEITRQQSVTLNTLSVNTPLHWQENLLLPQVHNKTYTNFQ